MSKLLRLVNVGLKGINSDMAAWSLPPEFITDGNNFRIFADKISSSGGYSDWSTADVPFNPGYIRAIGTQADDLWVVAGRSAIQSFDGNAWTDRSSVAGYTGLGVNDELFWNGDMLGRIIVVNNSQAQPEYWDSASLSQFEPLPFDPTDDWTAKGFRFDMIRSHNDFLFALSLHEGSEDIPSGYRWSHPAQANSVPYTWDETDTSALAGKGYIGGDGGSIVDGKSMRNSFVIYSEAAVNILDYTGDQFVWRRRPMSETLGLLTPQCITEVKGTHFLLTDGDIVSNDGNKLTSIIHDRLRARLTSQMSADFYHRSYVARNTAMKEIWFCVPESEAEYPNIAYIYNWRDDSWAIRDLPENISFSNYGQQSDPPQRWDDFTVETWAEMRGTWGSQNRTPLNNTIVGINTDSELKIIDTDGLSAGGDLNTFIERTNFPLEGTNEVTSISSIYPHISGSESVQITAGSQDVPDGAVRWRPAVTFTPGQDRKVDIRTTGRLHCWRIDSLGTGTWSFSGMDIEYNNSGKR